MGKVKCLKISIDTSLEECIEFLLVCFIAITPLSFMANISNLLLYALIGLFLMYLIKKKMIIFDKMIIMWFFLLGISFISILTGGFFEARSFFASTRAALFYLLLIFTLKYINLQKVIYISLKVVLILSIISVFYSIILYLFGNMARGIDGTINFIRIGPLQFEQNVGGMYNDLGYAGIFENPNTFSYYCWVSICGIIGNIFGKINIFYKICLLFSLLGIYLSNSRAGIIIVLLIFLFQAYTKINNRFVKVLLILIGIFGVFFTLILYFPQGNAVEINLTGREELWGEGIRLFTEHPIFGCGLFTTSRYLGGGMHNSYLTILAEIGIVGSIIFLIICISTVIMVRKQYIIFDKEWKFYYLYILIYFVYTLVENTFFNFSGRFIFWITLSIYIEVMYKRKIEYINTSF